MGVRKLEVSKDPRLAGVAKASEEVSGVFSQDEVLCLVSRIELMRLESAAREVEDARVRWWAWVSAQGIHVERRVHALLDGAEKRLGEPVLLPSAEATHDGNLTLTWMCGAQRLRVALMKEGRLQWSYDDGDETDQPLPAAFYNYLQILALDTGDPPVIEPEPSFASTATPPTAVPVVDIDLSEEVPLDSKPTPPSSPAMRIPQRRITSESWAGGRSR